jgi:MFS family permease
LSTEISALTINAIQRANFRHLYADVAWFGLLAGSTMAFVAVFATRMGANSFQISLLAAGPAVINLLFSIPAGRWLENRSLSRASFWSAVLHRVGYVLLIPLPWLFSDRLQIWAVVLITLLMSVPGTFLAIGFNALFADAVPPDKRGELVSKRSALTSIIMTAGTLLSGQLLDWDRIAFPLNYQIVFLLGALGAAMSTYHLSQIRLPKDGTPQRANRLIRDLARPGLLRFADSFRTPVGLRFLTRSAGKPLLRLDLLRTSYGPFLAAYLIFYIFQYIPIPLVPLYAVHNLALTDTAISLGHSLFNILVFLVSMRLGHYLSRFGNKAVLVTGAFFYGAYPLFLGLASDVRLFLVASFLGGISWAIVNTSMLNRLMEVVPEDDRPAYMALHNLTMNLGILVGSFIGPLLGVFFGLQITLLIAAGLRALSSVFLARKA